MARLLVVAALAGWALMVVFCLCLAAGNRKRPVDRAAPPKPRPAVTPAPKQVKRMSLREFRRRKGARQ